MSENSSVPPTTRSEMIAELTKYRPKLSSLQASE